MGSKVNGLSIKFFQVFALTPELKLQFLLIGSSKFQIHELLDILYSWQFLIVSDIHKAIL